MATRRSATQPAKPRALRPAPVKVAAARKPPAPAKEAKEPKAAKVKLVRDSFTIPKAEYAAIDALKHRAAKAGLPSKKSEMIRAGLMALAAMGDASFQAAVSMVPRLKTGRPKKD